MKKFYKRFLKILCCSLIFVAQGAMCSQNSTGLLLRSTLETGESETTSYIRYEFPERQKQLETITREMRETHTLLASKCEPVREKY